jgi:hypothetical protein
MLNKIKETMKRFVLILFFLLTVLIGCGDDDSNPKESCIETDTACAAAGKYKTCSNSNSTWYSWNGNKYTCASQSDCTAAAQELAADILEFCNP